MARREEEKKTEVKLRISDMTKTSYINIKENICTFSTSFFFKYLGRRKWGSPTVVIRVFFFLGGGVFPPILSLFGGQRTIVHA